MKNPLKKIKTTGKKAKESAAVSAEALAVAVNELAGVKRKLTSENKALDFRCQTLELTIREKDRQISQLEQVLKEKEEKIAELHKEVTEKKFVAAFYEKLADKAIEEKSRLKMQYCKPVTAGVDKNAAKEVNIDGRNSSM